MRRLIFAGALAAFASQAASPATGDELLFSNDYWAVSLDSDGEACWMTPREDPTLGGRYVSDDIIMLAADKHLAVLFIYNYSWNAAPRQVRVEFRVHRARFFADANVDRHRLEVPGLTRKFLRAFADREALSLHDADGVRLTTFSLRGSAPAAAAFIECWNQFAPRGISPHDPF
jgi:hypothetical protein